MTASAREKSAGDDENLATLEGRFCLSQQFKEAFKTALAVVIAVGIALAMDWGHTRWAVFAVAFCSLTTGGESLHKGLLRIGGVLVAFIVALTLVALFPQDRWLFLVTLSAYLSVCTYMAGGTSRWYFWFVAGLSVSVLTFGGGPNAVNDFDIVVLRTEMTVLGVLVYTLVSALLWPTSTKKVFEEAVTKLTAGQHQLFRKYIALMAVKGNEKDIAQLRNQLVQKAGALKGLLNGAEIDSLEIWEVRQAWRHCISQLAELNTRLDRWRHCCDTLRELDIETLFPELSAVTAELDARFEQIEKMLAGRPPTAPAQEISLPLEKVPGMDLSHFQRGIVVVGMKQLAAIEELTRSLFSTISNIYGFRVQERKVSGAKSRKPGIALDPDRAAGVLRMLMGVWSAYLLWIFLPDLPAYTGVINMTTALSMMCALAPQFPIKKLPKLILQGLSFAAIPYIFIMPRLEGFAELALLMFVVTFTITYMNAKPQQHLNRTIALVTFVMVTNIENLQTYNVLTIFNLSVALMIVVGILTVASYFPLSFRPELRFRHLLRRFFKSSQYLIAGDVYPLKHSRLQQWRRAFHLQEVTTIPAKLSQWGGFLPEDAMGKSSSAQIQKISNCVQALGWYVQGLIAVREEMGINDITDDEILGYIRTWRDALGDLLARLSVQPDAEDDMNLQAKLDTLLERLELKIEQSLDTADNQVLTPDMGNKGYTLLGAYRGLSEGLVDYTRSAKVVDWPRMAENRF